MFGRDSVLNTKFDIDWTVIKERKRRLISRNNQHENSKRIPYQYKVGDKILIRNSWKAKYASSPYDGPYECTSVYDNGTLRYRKGVVEHVINIRNVTPYYE